MSFPRLNEPIRIETLALRNRIVMPPMAISLAEQDGLVGQAHEEHYRSSAGPGLIFVEATAVLPEGRINGRQLGLWHDRHIQGLSRLARIIHEGGGAAGIQIHHAGALAFQDSQIQGLRQNLAKLVRLSYLQFARSGLQRIQAAFARASRRAVEAGFDVIEIHAAHGYLFSQLLSPLKNHRFDRYGGSPENRRRFLLEVFRTVSAAVKGQALVTCRLGVADRSERGLSLGEGLGAVQALDREGIKLFDVSSGSGTPACFAAESNCYSALLHLARAVKETILKPVIGVGGIRDPRLAESALQDGMADLIAVGRAMLADPAWARKTIEGKPGSITVCRDCKICFHHTDSAKCPARRSQEANPSGSERGRTLSSEH